MRKVVPLELEPKVKTYFISKEVKAVSVADALRKERQGAIFEIKEVYDNSDS